MQTYWPTSSCGWDMTDSDRPDAEAVGRETRLSLEMRTGVDICQSNWSGREVRTIRYWPQRKKDWGWGLAKGYYYIHYFSHYFFHQVIFRAKSRWITLNQGYLRSTVTKTKKKSSRKNREQVIYCWNTFIHIRFLSCSIVRAHSPQSFRPHSILNGVQP